MKALRTIGNILLLVLFGHTISASAQEQILSVLPSSGYPGQTQDIVIRGLGTAFKNGQTHIDFGQGITVLRTDVMNSETVNARISIAQNVPTGTSDLTITTGNNKVIKYNAFQIFQSGGALTATVVVTPVQTMHVSDFDPKNLGSSPLLFTVSVFNDNTPRDLNVLLTVSGQSLGNLATATKHLKSVSPNAVTRFDNRQFDKYKVANSNTSIIQTAVTTGTLPADVYIYHVTVQDNNGATLAEAEGSNVITNPLNKPELISPGNPFNADPTVQQTRQPLFQWFSQGNTFDFFVYEVKPGQHTQEEVALNRPFYQQTGITTSSLLFPSSAGIMEDGKVYAWKVVANYSGTNGQQKLSSELFWFRVTSSPLTKTVKTVNDIKVDPDQLTVGTGQTYRFKARGYDINSDSISIKPTWRVVPADGGKIDRDGNFTAGGNPNNVAIVAQYGDIQDYATVNIQMSKPSGASGGDAWAMDLFLRELFGLPIGK